MINEAQALALLDEVNPVPDMESYGLPEAEIAGHLTSLIDGSSAMTQLDIESKDQNEEKPVGWRWLAAAVLTILAGIAVIVVSQRSGTQVVGPPDPGPAEVIEAYITAYNAKDLEAVMDLFAEEATLIGHPFQSLGDIRTIQKSDMSAAKDGNAYTISNVDVSGNTVTWDHVWVNAGGSAFCAEGHIAVIEEGKILTWIWPDTRAACHAEHGASLDF